MYLINGDPGGFFFGPMVKLKGDERTLIITADAFGSRSVYITLTENGVQAVPLQDRYGNNISAINVNSIFHLAPLGAALKIQAAVLGGGTATNLRAYLASTR